MGLIKEVRGGVQVLRQEARDLEQFAVVISSALLLIAVLLFWIGRNPGRSLWFTGAAIIIILAALFSPPALKPLHKLWMALALFLGGLVSRFLLTLIFYLVITPIGLSLRLFGKDLLQKRKNKNVISYWRDRPVSEKTPDHYKRAF